MSVKHYFLDGNTSEGYYTNVGDLINGINNIHIITGSLVNAKTKLLKSIGDIYIKENVSVSYLHNPSNEDKLDGIIIPEKDLAFLDGMARHSAATKYYGLFSSVYNLDESLREKDLKIYKKEITKLINKYDKLHQDAYKYFSKGRQFHEKKEELYISAMDFNKANKVTSELMNSIFKGVVTNSDQKGLVKHLFFGAATPNGPVNYIENITEDINKRYIIKGRSGSGKSTVMRKVGKHAEELGLSVQYFPCGLDPNSLDMVIIPSLSTAILDGTAPHVINPTRPTDEVIDMFELCMDQSVEDKYVERFQELDMCYKEEMKKGTQLLKEAMEIDELMTNYYESDIDQELVDQRIKEYLKKI